MSALDLRRPGRRRSRSRGGRRRRRPGGRSPCAAREPAEVPHRPVQHRVGRLAVRAGHRLREPDAVLVREQVEVGVQLGLVGEVQRPEPAPVHEVVRHGQRRPRVRAARRRRRSSRAAPSDGTQVTRGSSTPAWPCRAPSPRRARARRRAARRRPARRRRSPPRRARRARRCPRRPAAAAGAARPSRRAAGRGVQHALGLVVDRPASGDITTPGAGERVGNGGHRHPLTPEPMLRRDEVPLERDEQRHGGRGQHAGAGQDRAERVRRRARTPCLM